LRYNKAYLALPAESRGLVDGKLFRGQWTGVVLYDLGSGSVVELIPSVPISTVGNGALDSLRSSIEEVRSRLSSIPRDLVELGPRLRRIEDKIQELERRISRLESRNATNAEPPQPTTGSLELDIGDNPWVEMLRRKGGG
jgi:hypothetical protein